MGQHGLRFLAAHRGSYPANLLGKAQPVHPGDPVLSFLTGRV